MQLECELLVKRRFRKQREAEAAVFDFIEPSRAGSGLTFKTNTLHGTGYILG
jgi:hypothetical protein